MFICFLIYDSSKGNTYNTQHRNQSYRQRSGEKDDYYGPPSEPQRRDRNDSSSSSWGPPPAAAGDQRSRSNSTSRYRQDTNNGDWKCLEVIHVHRVLMLILITFAMPYQSVSSPLEGEYY
mmetsp:Transcript_7852/g.11308  ORF Transcript_7852/g.11308 Transcript_7852/m.11308 type:complete len:120 (-) Transcript_7852:1729-2088(-)